MGTVDRYRKLNSAIGYSLLVMIIVIISTLLRWLGPGWIFSIDLFLLTAAVHALRSKPMNAQLFGLILGFLQDVYSGSLIGLNALSKMVVAYAISSSKDLFLIHGFLQRLLTLLLAVVADRIVHGMVFMLFSLEYPLSTDSLLLAMLINGAIGAIILIYVKYAERRAKRVMPYAESE